MKVAVSTYTSAIEWSEQWQTRPLFRNLLIWLRDQVKFLYSQDSVVNIAVGKGPLNLQRTNLRSAHW